LKESPNWVGFITNYHTDGPFLAPGASTTFQFLNIMAGSYSSLKYLQADDLDPMNFIAFGDSLAFY